MCLVDSANTCEFHKSKVLRVSHIVAKLTTVCGSCRQPPHLGKGKEEKFSEGVREHTLRAEKPMLTDKFRGSVQKYWGGCMSSQTNLLCLVESQHQYEWECCQESESRSAVIVKRKCVAQGKHDSCCPSPITRTSTTK